MQIGNYDGQSGQSHQCPPDDKQWMLFTERQEDGRETGSD